MEDTADDLASAGDTDGDGLSDLLISAYSEEAPGSAVYLVRDPPSGTSCLREAAMRYHGEGREDLIRGSLAGAGDVNDDGLSDIIIGAPFAEADWYQGARRT